MAHEIDIIAANIRRFRESRGWTQTRLAEVCGMKSPQISDIESGRANPTVKTLSKIATALDVETASLLIPATSEIAVTSP